MAKIQCAATYGRRYFPPRTAFPYMGLYAGIQDFFKLFLAAIDDAREANMKAMPNPPVIISGTSHIVDINIMTAKEPIAQ